MPVGFYPIGVAVNQNGKNVYIANNGDNVSVIDTATNTVETSVNANAGYHFYGVALTPD